MTLSMLAEWWNLIYLVPFGLAVLYLALFVFTGITFGEADADVDAHADVDAPVSVEAHVVDADADADVHAEVDADADADVEGSVHDGSAVDGLTHAHGDHGHDGHEAGGRGSLAGDLLAFLGLGKIPVSLSLMILMLWWGVVGFILNAMFFSWLGSELVGLITVPLTVVISVLLTGGCAAVLGKVFPGSEGRGQRREDLVGRAGDAILDIDATFGMASVRNATGDLIQVPCQTRDAQIRIPKGSRVVLFNYDREKGVFHVAPFAA